MEAWIARILKPGGGGGGEICNKQAKWIEEEEEEEERNEKDNEGGGFCFATKALSIINFQLICEQWFMGITTVAEKRPSGEFNIAKLRLKSEVCLMIYSL